MKRECKNEKERESTRTLKKQKTNKGKKKIIQRKKKIHNLKIKKEGTWCGYRRRQRGGF